MTERRPQARPTPLILALLAATACMTPLQKLASNLDEVEGYLEEWGVVSVSGALVVPDKKRFATDYNRSLAEHITAAQTQLHAGVVKSIERVAEIRNATKASNAVGAEPTEGGPAAPPDVTVTGTFAEDRFSAPRSLLGDREYSIPLTEAVRAGYSSKFQEQLLDFLANPGDLKNGEELYLVVTQVSCNPGWRTRTDYMADVRISVHDGPSDKPHADTATVRVAAVLPLVETQNLDLEVSLRDQVALLSSLSAVLEESGASAESSTVSQYADRLQQDAASKTVQPIISSYVSGKSFGYQFRPVYRAIDDLTDPRSEGEYVLNPVSFPVLALIVTTGDVDRVTLTQENNWYRLDRPGFWSRADYYVTWPFYAAVGARSDTPPRANLVDRIGHLEMMDRVGQRIVPATTDPNVAKTLATTVGSEALAGLHNKYLGLLEGYSSTPQAVRLRPPAKEEGKRKEEKPAAFGVGATLPDVGWIDRDTVLLIEGSGFGGAAKPNVKEVTVGGRKCAVTVIGDNTLLAVVPALPSAANLEDQLVVVATAKAVKSSSNRVSLTARAGNESPVPGLRITRDGEGRVTGIQIENLERGDATSLLDRIQKVLETTGRDDIDLDIDVEASGAVRASAQSGSSGS